MKTTASAFVFHKDKLLLIKHRRHSIWMHPGGHAEEGETPDEAAMREVKEETNIDIEFLSDPWPVDDSDTHKGVPRPFYIHVNADKTLLMYDYIAVAKSEDVKIQETEIESAKWVTKNDLEDITPNILKALIIKAFEKYEKFTKNQLHQK